jgi:hypothetical protein
MKLVNSSSTWIKCNNVTPKAHPRHINLLKAIAFVKIEISEDFTLL